MSLLGSIFGTEKSSSTTEGNALSGLFDHSSELPERPHHVPPEPRQAKRKQPEPAEETPTKRRKPRKPKKVEQEESKDDETPKSGESPNDTNQDNKDEGNNNVDKDETDEKEGAEDRTIFVGNLPLKGTTRKSLISLFRDKCGAVESARIRGVPGVQGVKLPPQNAGNQNMVKKICVNQNLVDYDNAAKDTVQGYVVFKSIDSVDKALELNNQLVVDGRRLRIDRASPTVEPSRSVFCGNLPYQADETSLQEHFMQGCELEVGDIEGVRIIRDKETFQCKGFGYVLLKNKSLVPIALKMHESTYQKKQIRVLVCGKRFKNKKGQDDKKARTSAAPIAGTASVPEEKVTVGAFRRIIAKQKKEVTNIHKRKRGDTKKTKDGKAARQPGVSKRAALDKKVEKRVKKIQKRITKGMGKAKR